MVVHPVVASVVGQVTDNRWGQVLQTPHAYGVVEINSLSGTARQRGIHILTELTKAFEVPPVSLTGLAAIADTVMREDVVSLILLVPVGTTLYMVSRGQGRVYLKRESKLAVLLTASQSLSGDIRSGDVIVVATTGFVQTLSSEEIMGVFDHLLPVEVAEKLTMLLHEKEGGEGGAALIFQVSEPTEDVLIHPSPVARPLIFRHAKDIGRRVLTLRQRIFLRRAATLIRHAPALSPKRLVVYAIMSLFVMSVILGIRHQQTVKRSSKLIETLTEAQHSFDEGMALLDLNPVKGRERLSHAKDILAPIVERKLRSTDGQNASHLYGEVVDNLTRSMHIVRAVPELFFDVSFLKKGAVISDISLFEDTIGMLDVGGKTLFTLEASSKNGTIVGGGDAFSGALHIAAYGDKLYVWTPRGINMVRLSDQKTVPNTIPASLEWGMITDMMAFGGNVYLLDAQKGRIWKYVATEKGFSDLFEYLNPDTLPDLSKTTNMAIDGSVWLGSTTGAVSRFTSGKENTYSPQGVDTPLGKLLDIYTNDATKMVYVLDATNHRVVVFDKDGLYMSQYVWDNGLQVSEIVASESLNKLFLLAEGKLYAVKLQ